MTLIKTLDEFHDLEDEDVVTKQTTATSGSPANSGCTREAMVQIFTEQLLSRSTRKCAEDSLPICDDVDEPIPIMSTMEQTCGVTEETLSTKAHFEEIRDLWEKKSSLAKTTKHM